jgi:acyl-CoA thioester hydrolase, YbgC/YbaW family
MAEKFMVPFKVRNYHIDSYDHVNNAQYMTLLEEARTQFMESAGCPFEYYFNQGVFIFVSDIHIKFKKPAVLGDHLEVHVWFPTLKRARIVFQQEIRLADSGELIATASVSCGFVHNGYVIPVPKDFLEKMQPFHIPDQV